MLPDDGVTLWYRVRNLAAARDWYTRVLGFGDPRERGDGWLVLRRESAEIALAQGEPDPQGPVAHVDVEDVKAEAERLRAAGADVGVVLELHGAIRLVEVTDPDGNRIEFGQEL